NWSNRCWLIKATAVSPAASATATYGSAKAITTSKPRRRSAVPMASIGLTSPRLPGAERIASGRDIDSPLDVIFGDLPVGRRPADPEQFGGLRHVAAGPLQRQGDQPSFPVVDAQGIDLVQSGIVQPEVRRQD